MPWEQETGRGLGTTAAIPGKAAFPRDQGPRHPCGVRKLCCHFSVHFKEFFCLVHTYINVTCAVRCCFPGMCFIQILSTFCGILLYLEDFSGCSALHRFVLTICTGAKFILRENCVGACVRGMLSSVPSVLAIRGVSMDISVSALFTRKVAFNRLNVGVFLEIK